MSVSNGMNRHSFTLAAIVALGVLLHVINVDYPDRPVFDEAHFATYAADYAYRRPHLDIHPPLGKTIYAAAILLFDQNPPDESRFVKIEKDSRSTNILYEVLDRPYGGFPYIALRLTNAVFGILLPVFAYLFLRQIVSGTLIPLLAAFFILVENSLLVETRLILLNGMYLAFGLAALTCFFHRQRRKPLLGGILWGFALNVKLLALGFSGPVIISLLVDRDIPLATRIRNAAAFFFAGIGVFLILLAALNSFFVPVDERISYYQTLIPWISRSAPEDAFPNAPAMFRTVLPHAKATLVELNTILSGYTVGVDSHPAQSNWYLWPFMVGPILYFPDALQDALAAVMNGAAGIIVLMGNPVVWFGGTAAVIWIFVDILRRGKQIILEKYRIPLLLLGGYALSLLPFMTVVKRVAFLYHYFPGLIFSILLTSFLVGKSIEAQSPRRRFQLLLSVIALAVGGFILISPYTFGW